jgi:hypothetical protein
MRIPRPYDTEEDFIRGDGLAIGRLGMILIGAPKRPPGITIRFEVLLRNDQPVFRGEGRVVAHRIHGNGREGLEIRFTRLDSRSKALVEQVLKLRRSGALTPLSATNPPPAPSPEATPSKADIQAPPQQPEAPIPQPEVEAQAPTAPPTEPPTELPTEEVLDSSELASVEPPTEPPAEEILDSSELAPVESESFEGEAEEVTLDSVEADEDVVQSAEASVPPVQTEDDIDDAGVDASAEPAELPVEEPDDEPLDEDPTPFAPPVMLEEFEQDEAATEERVVALPPPPPVELSADVASALSKLRERAGAFERPESASSLLDRLRERAKSD